MTRVRAFDQTRWWRTWCKGIFRKCIRRKITWIRRNRWTCWTRIISWTWRETSAEMTWTMNKPKRQRKKLVFFFFLFSKRRDFSGIFYLKYFNNWQNFFSYLLDQWRRKKRTLRLRIYLKTKRFASHFVAFCYEKTQRRNFIRFRLTIRFPLSSEFSKILLSSRFSWIFFDLPNQNGITNA